MTIRTTEGDLTAELIVKQEAESYMLCWETQDGRQIPTFCGIGSTRFASEIAAIGFGELTWGLIARRGS